MMSLATPGFAQNSGIDSSPEYLNWIEKAEKGDAEKGYLSGLAFYHGVGGAKRDYKKAFEWFKKAAKDGNSAAGTKIGDMYIWGHFVAKDEQKAFQWYLQAAKAGNTESMEKLADIYATGEIFEKNYFEAAKWYQNAAENSYISSPSLKLARIYYLGGEHFEKDEKKALKWFINAFEMGDADAAHYISGIYEDNGDSRQAGQWLIKGAHKGGTLPMFYLAKAYGRIGEYSNKSIVKFDMMQAYKWLSVLTKKEYQSRFDKLFEQVSSKISQAEKAEAKKLAAPLIAELVTVQEFNWTKKNRAKPLKLK
ncbi:MAG: sel1 repeat family protein [Elusimicrobia bacterium]|nr:sel1 repeat family protein [Elusimicrobiota bacterium]